VIMDALQRDKQLCPEVYSGGTDRLLVPESPWLCHSSPPRLVSSSVESSAVSPLVTLWTAQCLVCETSGPVLRGR